MHGCSAIVPYSASVGPSCCSGGARRVQKFVAPDDEEREVALGSLAGTPFVLSRVLACAQAWSEPMDVPREEDWLAQHHETGQTFDAFRQGFKEHKHKLAPNEDRCTIHLLPIGNFGHCPQLLPSLMELCSVFFAPLRCALLRMQVPPIEVLRDCGLEADITLRWITQNLRKDSVCTMALTMAPLSCKGTPIFGLSNWDNRVGIFSLAVYAEVPVPPPMPSAVADEPEDDDFVNHDDLGDMSWLLLLERCCKLVTHEVLHLFGVMHCIYSRCLMNGSNNLTEMDSKPSFLCAMCLRKLHEAIHFSPLERYEKLAEFWKSAGFPATAEWYRFRVLIVKQTFAANEEVLKSKKMSTHYVQQTRASHPCQGEFCTYCRDQTPKGRALRALPDGVPNEVKSSLPPELERSVFDISNYEMMLAKKKMQAVAKVVQQRERSNPLESLTKLRMRYKRFFQSINAESGASNKDGEDESEKCPDSPRVPGDGGAGLKARIASQRMTSTSVTPQNVDDDKRKSKAFNPYLSGSSKNDSASVGRNSVHSKTGRQFVGVSKTATFASSVTASRGRRGTAEDTASVKMAPTTMDTLRKRTKSVQFTASPVLFHDGDSSKPL